MEVLARGIILPVVVAALLGGYGAAILAADSAQISELGHAFPGYRGAGGSGIAIADVDGDGLSDFIYGASAGASDLLFVVGRLTDGSVGLKQSLLAADGKLVRVLTARSSGEDAVYTVATDGTVTAYGHWPLQPLRSFPTRADASVAAVGDLNADGLDEIVIGADSHLHSYALGTGELLWQVMVGWYQTDIALAQLDGDPALEIVLGGYNIVVDGATGAIEGTGDTSFGHYVAAGLLDPNSGVQIATAGYSLQVVDGHAPWQVSWIYDLEYGAVVTALTTADLDGDSRDEILFGRSFSSTVHVIDGITRLERQTFEVPYYWVGGLRSISGAADVDGDGTKELAIAASGWGHQQWFWNGQFRVVDTKTSLTKAAIPEIPGRYGAVALADVDGNGRVEQVIGSAEESDKGMLHIVDALTGRLEWASPDTQNPIGFSINAVAVGRFGGGPGSDIVLGGENSSDGAIAVLDGVSREVRLRIYQYSNGPLRSRPVAALALLDYDRDGVPDIVAATRVGRGMETTGAAAELRVFSGTSGALLAVSPAVGPARDSVNGLLVMDADGAPELVLALASSIRAFDASTLQPTWILPATSAGIRHVTKGAAGPELLSFNGNGGVSFYSSRTRAFLRSIPTPRPTTAVIALDDDVRDLVVAAAGRLHLIDGISGDVRAVSEYLGTAFAQGNQLAAVQTGNAVWQIASGGDAGYYRHRVELSEYVFSDGFEPTAD